MAPTVLGIDVSHWQGAVNWSVMRSDGVQFAGIKSTEGDGFVDSRFASNLRNARAAGVIPFAYHYQRSTATAAEQVAHIRRVVPRDCPVVPDVEHGSGNVALTRGIVAGLRRAGYHVPLSYIPRWYWQGIGSPGLSGLPPLWSSRYPDNVIRSIRDEYREVEMRFMHFWQGYGGLNVAVLQFTSSARVGNRQPIDGNAYRGTVTQLRTLLTGSAPPPEEDDMPSLQELLDTRIGSNANDALRDRYAERPGTLGHFLLNQGDDINTIRQAVLDIQAKLNNRGGPA